jgi:lipopolysaccharide biosynthesis glycosyltransferase
MIAAVYVAYGDNARAEAKASIASLRKWHKRLPIYVLGDAPIGIGDAQLIKFNEPGAGARWAKLNIDRLVECDRLIYLDADTRILDSLSPAIAMLEAYDLIMTYSANQGYDVLNHIEVTEREATLTELGNPYPLQLQAGVMFINRLRCLKLFEIWRQEWQRWHNQDQAALLRALNKEPVRIGLLGLDWNSTNGTVVQHLFGRAR